MAEQFLKRPQVRASRQQVRCKAVPKRVRSQRVGETEPPPRGSDRPAHEIRVERPSPRSHEQRHGSMKRIRALPRVVVDRVANGGDHRHDPHLRSLPGHPQGRSDRQQIGGQRHRFGDAQARAVQQQQDGKVSRADPGRAGGVRRIFGEVHGFVRCCWARQGARPLGRARPRKLRRHSLLFGDVDQEGAHSGELAGGRCGAEAAGSAIGEKGAKIGGVHARQRGRVDRFAAIASEEFDQPVSRRDVGAHGVNGAAAIVLKIGRPARSERLGRMVGYA